MVDLTKYAWCDAGCENGHVPCGPCEREHAWRARAESAESRVRELEATLAKACEHTELHVRFAQAEQEKRRAAEARVRELEREVHDAASGGEASDG